MTVLDISFTYMHRQVKNFYKWILRIHSKLMIKCWLPLGGSRVGSKMKFVKGHGNVKIIRPLFPLKNYVTQI